MCDVENIKRQEIISSSAKVEGNQVGKKQVRARQVGIAGSALGWVSGSAQRWQRLRRKMDKFTEVYVLYGNHIWLRRSLSQQWLQCSGTMCLVCPYSLS